MFTSSINTNFSPSAWKSPPDLSHTPPQHSHSPPSDMGSPLIPTPQSSGIWGERENAWSVSARDAMRIPEERRGLGAIGRRSVLSEMHRNQVPALGLDSPYNHLPPPSNTSWGPPLSALTPSSNVNLVDKTAMLEEELSRAHKQIEQLSIENINLRQREASLTRHGSYASAQGMSPALSTHSSMLLGDFSHSMSYPGFGGHSLSSSMMFNDDETGMISSEEARSLAGSDGTQGDSSLIFPPRLKYQILRGTFNYHEMSPSEIRPVVYIIASEKSRGQTESAALKAAVSALANCFNQARSSIAATKLIDAIIEYAPELCTAASGNYLCQQLIERAEMKDKEDFVEKIKDKIVDIASDKHGIHVITKAMAYKELEETMIRSLLEYGVANSLKTGARKIWAEHLRRSWESSNLDIFHRINADMEGQWADLACFNEHASIAVQQFYENSGQKDLKEPSYREFKQKISQVANNQFGHFVVTKLLHDPHFARDTAEAILTAYPPVAITHHGVNFVKMALSGESHHLPMTMTQPNLTKYINAICSTDENRTPGIIQVANSTMGKSHLTVFVLGALAPQERFRVVNVCRQYSTTLRNSQSGNDLLRTLGIIHTVGSRNRYGGPM